jgi:ribosomal protein S18 acetylase RimI-like enzyme
LEVGRLEHAELPAATEILARAFRDNPLNRAVIRAEPAARVRSNRAGVRSYLPLAHEFAYVAAARAEGRVVGVLVATPPWRWPLPAPGPLGLLRLLFGQGFGVVRRWSEVSARLREHHPGQPHWYLATLGVDPEHQGAGAGRALVQAFTALADADRSAAYLETDRPELEGFYRRAGFRVRERIAVFEVPVLGMERPVPSSSAPAPPAGLDESPPVPK